MDWNAQVDADRSDGEAARAALMGLAGVIDQLAARTDVHDPEAAESLRAVNHRLRAPRASVAFLGRFSSGKTSAINCALGRDLLPTSDLMETGIPCLVRQGARDALYIWTKDGGVRREACATVNIARYVSLRTDDGTLNADLDEVDRIEIEIEDFGSRAMDWLDTPGLSGGDEGLHATRIAGQADLTFWVVGTRPFLGKAEAQAIADHVKAFGPQGVVLLVNVRLPHRGDPAVAWHDALAKVPAWRARMQDMWREVGLDPDWTPPTLLLSAAQALATPEACGGPELRAMLAAHDAPDRPRVVQARAHRALHDIEHVGAALATRLEAVRAQGVARLAAVAAHEAQVSRDFARARRRVVDALEAFSAAYRRRAEAIGEELAGQIRAASKIPPDIVETTRARLVQAAETERETLRVSLSKTADGVAWRGKPSDLSFLQTGPIDFAIADNGLKATKAAPGVVIGGIIGLLGGPIGAAVGAAIGGALSGGAAAYEQDILDTCARLTEAASGAAGNINAAAQGGEVRLLDLCYSTRKPPAQLGSPDAADPAEIEQLITDLGYLAELIHEALGEDSANDGEATVIPATYGKAAP